VEVARSTVRRAVIDEGGTKPHGTAGAPADPFEVIDAEVGVRAGECDTGWFDERMTLTVRQRRRRRRRTGTRACSADEAKHDAQDEPPPSSCHRIKTTVSLARSSSRPGLVYTFLTRCVKPTNSKATRCAGKFLPEPVGRGGSRSRFATTPSSPSATIASHSAGPSSNEPTTSTTEGGPSIVTSSSRGVPLRVREPQRRLAVERRGASAGPAGESQAAPGRSTR
jgi:hypothetical protein